MGMSDEANPAPNDAAQVLISPDDNSDISNLPAAAALASELCVVSTEFWKR